MEFVLRSFVFAVIIGLTANGPSALAQDAPPATPVAGRACADAASLDLPAVTLTTADLTAAGLEGFGNSSAGPYGVEDDVAYLAESLGKDAGDVRSVLLDGGYSGSYFSTQSLPADAINRAGQPAREIQIGVYPFAGAQGAAAGYQLLTDESSVPGAEDIDGAATFGDASELTRTSGDDDPATGQPFRELELEFLRGCLVISVSLFDYGSGATEPEVVEIERLGKLLVGRVDDVLAGRTPGLDALALDLQTDADLASLSFVFYAMIDGEPVREWNETDEDFADRSDTWNQLGFASALRSNAVIPFDEDTTDGELTYFNTLIEFPDEETASAYMRAVPDRFAGNPVYIEVSEIEDIPALGDESVALALTREMGGARWTLNELFVRVGEIVSVSWIERPNAGPTGPEVGVEPLTELAAAQVACLTAGGACPPAPVPAGLPSVEIVPVATPPSKLPRWSPDST